MSKLPKKLENIHAQNWLKRKIQPYMDRLNTLQWLRSPTLTDYFKKISYDCYSSPMVFVLVVIGALWTCLRYARLEHPGSCPIRLGHIIFLGAVSSGGKNAALGLVMACLMAAFDLWAADVYEHQIYDIDDNDDNDVKDNDDDDDASNRKAKADAMRARTKQNNDGKDWIINSQLEAKIFDPDRVGDMSRVRIDGSTKDELLKQNAKLEGKSIWIATEFYDVAESMKGDEQNLIIDLSDKTVGSKTAGTVYKRQYVSQNQAVGILAGQMGCVLKLHGNKASQAASSRVTVCMSDRVSSSGIMRLANNMDFDLKNVLIDLLYKAIKLAVSDVNPEQADKIIKRAKGIIFSFPPSAATEQAKKCYENDNHLQNMQLDDDLLDECKEPNVKILKSNKAGSIDHWQAIHSFEMGGEMNILPKELVPLLELRKDNETVHLNNRFTRRWGDVAVGAQCMYAMEKALVNKGEVILDASYLKICPRAAQAASEFVLVNREMNGVLCKGMDVIISMNHFNATQADKLFDILCSNGNNTDGHVLLSLSKCSNKMCIKKVMVFSKLKSTSEVNVFVKQKITGPKTDMFVEVAEELKNKLLTWEKKTGRGVSNFVAHKINVIKISTLSSQDVQNEALRILKDIIDAPYHKGQKNLVISLKKYADMSGDSEQWLKQQMDALD